MLQILDLIFTQYAAVGHISTIHILMFNEKDAGVKGLSLGIQT